MKLTTTTPSMTITQRATFGVTGPVIPAASSATGKLMRIEFIMINYTVDADGQWGVRFDSSIELSGPYLKKDGSDSAVHADNRAPFGFVRGDVKMPWLTAVVDALRPTGEIIIPTTHSLEIEDPR